VLLHIMTLSLEAAPAGTISIGSSNRAESFGLQVHALPAPSAESCNSGPTYPEREGIGLEISQKMMEAMGGSLCVSVDGHGGWIAHLLWPVTSAQVLLVIDDNKHFHDLFQRYLSGYNWQVIGSTSIAKGRDILAEMHPRLILLDIMMPKEDGWQLLHTLRASEETRDIPVIICSVLNQPHLARSLGASGYLRKPVTQQALLQALSPWLAESSILQQEY
jgi:CheY-like chemotaxis protein